ncbi:NAD(P)-binding protein [Daedalea quercina L-15889]|uniref:NAD(P)-binding protein n=1 Tax=Daedalea quercina L-15889 TaxID=1314783 RepID=A0A165SY40_9APHY|nr:NAD(P)-binding protein [Daedalea quercina L-15889]
MGATPFALVCPSTRGLSLAITRHLLRTTDLPVFATHRSRDAQDVRDNILSPLKNVNPDRLRLLHLDLTSEKTMASAAEELSKTYPNDAKPYLHTAFFCGGVLHPERRPTDLDREVVEQTFQINVISHLLLMKHFSRFLSPPASNGDKGRAGKPDLAKWVHVSARVGSISDNRLGGWFSYRASKAALNQAIHTFDLYLQQKKIPAICIGTHPGTVKTELSKEFWGGVPENKLFEPEYAAEKLVNVVQGLDEKSRGRIWDWAGKEVPP